MKCVSIAVNSIVRYVNLATGQPVLSADDRTLCDIVTLAVVSSKQDNTPQQELVTKKDNNTQ